MNQTHHRAPINGWFSARSISLTGGKPYEMVFVNAPLDPNLLHISMLADYEFTGFAKNGKPSLQSGVHGIKLKVVERFDEDFMEFTIKAEEPIEFNSTFTAPVDIELIRALKHRQVHFIVLDVPMDEWLNLFEETDHHAIITHYPHLNLYVQTHYIQEYLQMMEEKVLARDVSSSQEGKRKKA